MAEQFVERWSQKTQNADAKLAFGRFETFLGIGAKLECSAGSKGYKEGDKNLNEMMRSNLEPLYIS